MCAFQFLLSVDPSLGRMNYSLMSDQSLMEMLIERFDDETKETYRDKHGMYLDICEWPGIKCGHDDRVFEIKIDSRNVLGSLEISCAPPKVKVLHVSSWAKSKLTGSIDLTNLPDEMKCLLLSCNTFTGEIDLAGLPEGMKNLYLSRNEFTGEINLTHLPDGMEYLSLNNNRLSG